MLCFHCTQLNKQKVRVHIMHRIILYLHRYIIKYYKRYKYNTWYTYAHTCSHIVHMSVCLYPNIFAQHETRILKVRKLLAIYTHMYICVFVCRDVLEYLYNSQNGIQWPTTQVNDLSTE